VASSGIAGSLVEAETRNILVKANMSRRAGPRAVPVRHKIDPVRGSGA
jgi:hypothetical protein